MDPLYPARKLRHKFAKTVMNADDNMGGWMVGSFAAVGGTMLLALGGSIALEDVPMGEIHPDTEMAVNAAQVEQGFSNQIVDLADKRSDFLAGLEDNSLMNDASLQAQQQAGTALKTEMESLASRIVMTDALSEEQAAELLEEFSDDVGSIDELGFATSDFGHLRESRESLTSDPGADWTQIAKQITHLAAEEDLNDQTYPFRAITGEDGEEIGTGEKVFLSILVSAVGGLFGTLGGMIFVLLSTMMEDSRRMRKWAQDEPKTKPRRAPYSGH